MKHAFKREYVDEALRAGLMRIKVSTGVHDNYLAMVRSVTKDHPTDISPLTLRGWLKAWCEKDKLIPEYYSRHDVKKSRTADFPRGKKPDPQFSIFEDDSADGKTKPEAINVTDSETKISAIRVGIDDRYAVIVSNGIQELKISSENGILSISRS